MSAFASDPTSDTWNHIVYAAIHLGAPPTALGSALLSAACELPLIIGLLVSAGCLLRDREWGGVLVGLCATGLAIASEAFISWAAYQPRPFAAGYGPAWVAHAANNSMPSTHVTVSCIWAMVLATRRHAGGALAVGVCAALMAWARVAAGIHWPQDILGAAVGSIVSVIIAVSGVRVGERWNLYRVRGPRA
ncbi:phosphatase PAP2 family protein [Luteibacter anthropi]|nr:phosphatase PAP2 family protein [Luteibacter anthropi]